MSLGCSLAVAVVFARTVLPRAVRLLALHATDELYQLTIIAFCLIGSWISGRLVRSRDTLVLAVSSAWRQCHTCFQSDMKVTWKAEMVGVCSSLRGSMQGLSTELGAFVAGVMLSTTDQQEHALHQLEQVPQTLFKEDGKCQGK